VIAVDTNLLVYTHREDSAWHKAAAARMTELAEDRTPWAIPWPCLDEFVAIVTHPRAYVPPTPLAGAIDQIEAWLGAPGLVRSLTDEAIYRRQDGRNVIMLVKVVPS
jgi:uncharacterized protein